jgi:hypothetical protein
MANPRVEKDLTSEAKLNHSWARETRLGYQFPVEGLVANLHPQSHPPRDDPRVVDFWSSVPREVPGSVGIFHFHRCYKHHPAQMIYNPCWPPGWQSEAFDITSLTVELVYRSFRWILPVNGSFVQDASHSFAEAASTFWPCC